MYMLMLYLSYAMIIFYYTLLMYKKKEYMNISYVSC